MIYDFSSDFDEYADEHGWDVSAGHLKWNFFENYTHPEHPEGMPLREFLRLYSEGYKAGAILKYRPPIDGPSVIAALTRLNSNCDIHWVTHRDILEVDEQTIWDSTAAWLERWSIPWDSLHVTSQKGTMASAIASGQPILGVVEDKPENLYDIVSATNAMGFLVDAPYNRDEPTRERMLHDNRLRRIGALTTFCKVMTLIADRTVSA